MRLWYIEHVTHLWYIEHAKLLLRHIEHVIRVQHLDLGVPSPFPLIIRRNILAVLYDSERKRTK